MFKSTIVLLALSMFVSTQLYAQKVEPESVLAVALSGMANLRGFSSTFKQELSYAEGGQRIYTGTLAVSRPGKFRWQYITPYEQVYISNGDGIWLYEPDLMQVQRLEDLGEVDPVVLQLLDGRIGLNDIDVVDKSSEKDVSVWHVHIGKAEQSAEVWLGVKNKALYWLESRDVLSNKNRLYLLNVETKAPPAQRFEFVAPEGVDVIGVNE